MNNQNILPLCVQGLNLSVREKSLIDHMSFQLEHGTRTIILGPNGAGKSLLLRLCHGLLKPTAGEILWSGENSKATRQPHAMVFQRPVLLRRSAIANITHALALAGLGPKERHDRARDTLMMFGLSGLADQYARSLSGGEQQRLAMARVWALGPQVLFLDEPTAALDPAATYSIEEMINTFHQSGVKIIMTTHDLGQARRLGDEIMFIHQGKLLEKTSSSVFFASPATDQARAFIKGELRW